MVLKENATLECWSGFFAPPDKARVLYNLLPSAKTQFVDDYVLLASYTTRQNSLHMDAYIANQLAAAKELLESGVQLNNPSLIVKSMNIYESMKSTTKDSEEYRNDVMENMVRACSAMCLFDPRNAKLYLDRGARFD